MKLTKRELLPAARRIAVWWERLSPLGLAVFSAGSAGERLVGPRGAGLCDGECLHTAAGDGLGLCLTACARQPSACHALYRLRVTGPEGKTVVCTLATDAWRAGTAPASDVRLPSLSEREVAALDHLLHAAAQELLRACAGAQEPGLVAHCGVMEAVMERALLAARSERNILLTGETGTGKELLAEAIHRASARAAGPFVVVQCGGLPDSLLESELFGHRRGAFTGAIGDKQGLVETAGGGTLVLDEIQSASAALQARLMRLVERHSLLPVGAVVARDLDARIITASNQSPEELTARADFRHDLLYRLRVLHLALPPLRERREEIEPLALQFVARACREDGRASCGLSPEALAALQAYRWPGNVRELRHEVEHAVLLADHELRPEHLSPHVRRGAVGEGRVCARMLYSGEALHALRSDAEREAIEALLERHHGQLPRVADTLGISLRTLYRRLSTLGIQRAHDGASSAQPSRERG